MDRRTVMAVILSLGIWYAWLAFRGPQLREVDGLQVTDGQGIDGQGSTGQPPEPVAPVAVAPEVVPEVAPEVSAETIPFSLCGVEGSLSTDGGRLHDAQLPDHRSPFEVTPLYTYVWGRITGSIEGTWSPWGPEPGAARLLSDHASALVAGATPKGARHDARMPMRIISSNAGEIVLEGTTATGVGVRRTLRERVTADDVCNLDLEVTWRNQGATRFDGDLYLYTGDRTPAAAGGRYSSQRQPMALVDGSVWYGGGLGAGCVQEGTQLTDEMPVIPAPGPVTWFGISDRYFGLFVLPPASAAGGTLALERHGQGEDAVDGGVFVLDGGLDPGQARTEHFVVYLGPNHAAKLEAVDPSLGRVVDLGWFAFFGYPLLWLLRKFHSLVGNWGIAIILLTFLVKAVFFPMTQKSFKSMQRMQQIQPELNKLREKYADNPQEMNKKTLELMQHHKVNPLSGCLPTLIQMPVWIALYNVLLTSVDLYHTEFLYLRDLTAPDPFLALPVTITLLMWLQQQFSTPANLDPTQQQVMKLMPLVFGLMFFAFPSGLAVYVFVNMTLSIGQQWLIKRSLATEGVPATAGVG